MDSVKSLADWMAARGVTLESVLSASRLDAKVVEAILHGRYTPSPQQRQRLAQALGVAPEEILWGHTTQVDHMYGHGPQFGRSP
jgi:transcriptional regulator with XRE-family HTH domain